MMNPSNSGHRQRLRQRFLASETNGLGEIEMLELLLTFAIPRRDVASLAHQLLEQFGSLSNLFAASCRELLAVPGIGEQTAVLIRLVVQLTHKATNDHTELSICSANQPPLFELDLEPVAGNQAESKEPRLRTFVNDEIVNSLTFIPQAAQFDTFESFKMHLRDRLPYNSESTRRKRTNHILNRFFPDDRLDIPLIYYAAHCASQQDFKSVLFYHVLKAEPLASKVAEEFIWPALPMGYVNRKDMKELIVRYMPDIGTSSLMNVLRSIFVAYDLLSIGVREDTTLRFQIHQGTLEGFLYVLVSEFPKPGMYTFDSLEQGPMRHWLLWDREWMRQQLYRLRDVGIVSKISEIDTIRQFTLQFDQWQALRHYFEQ